MNPYKIWSVQKICSLVKSLKDSERNGLLHRSASTLKFEYQGWMFLEARGKREVSTICDLQRLQAWTRSLLFLKTLWLLILHTTASLSSHWFNLICIWLPHIASSLLSHCRKKGIFFSKRYFLCSIINSLVSSKIQWHREKPLGSFLLTFLLPQ